MGPTHDDFAQLRELIVKSINDAIAKDHPCKFSEKHYQSLVSFSEWWEREGGTLRGIVDTWNKSKYTWVQIIWFGLTGGIVFLIYLAFSHGWNPLKK